MKIKNYIFDLGLVLVSYTPESYLKDLGYPNDLISKYSSLFFRGKEWLQSDAGLLSYEEMVNTLLQNYPMYKEDIRKIFSANVLKRVLGERIYASTWLKEVKEKGYRIYILSDLSEACYQICIHYSYNKYVDGGIYSYQTKHLKTSTYNFNYLLNQYQLNPDECVFIDDNINNLIEAHKTGINTIRFTDLEDTKKKLEKLINSKESI